MKQGKISLLILLYVKFELNFMCDVVYFYKDRIFFGELQKYREYVGCFNGFYVKKKLLVFLMWMMDEVEIV